MSRPQTPRLEFRPAAARDLEALVALLADDPLGATREAPSKPLDPRYAQAFAAIDSDPNNELILLEADGQLAGMMQLTFIPYLTHTGSWRCLVEGVRVARAFRGRGFGSRMLERAIERARERGCGLVQLTSDKQRPDALRFYETLGFRATHEGFKLRLET